MAGATRLELATSGLTGRRSNQTELRPRNLLSLPIRLRKHFKNVYDSGDLPACMRDVLTKLNYAPVCF
jgi:hypothetical protein